MALSIMTVNITSISIMAFSMITLFITIEICDNYIKILSITTLSITTLNIMT